MNNIPGVFMTIVVCALAAIGCERWSAGRPPASPVDAMEAARDCTVDICGF